MTEHNSPDTVVVTRCGKCQFAALPNTMVQKYGIPGTRVCHNEMSPCRKRLVKATDYCPYGGTGDG